MEVHRPEGVLDAFQWYCEQCTTLLYEVKLPVKDIVKDLPGVMEAFYADSEKCRCKACGHVMERP
jgi:3-hydroxyanthranilate 3,4-dioxygenase